MPSYGTIYFNASMTILIQFTLFYRASPTFDGIKIELPNASQQLTASSWNLFFNSLRGVVFRRSPIKMPTRFSITDYGFFFSFQRKSLTAIRPYGASTVASRTFGHTANNRAVTPAVSFASISSIDMPRFRRFENFIRLFRPRLNLYPSYPKNKQINVTKG